MSIQWGSLEQKIGHVFANRKWLKQALTHASFDACNNERMEFLGDSLLNNIVGIWLYHRFPQSPEGVLTRLRSNWVNTEFLNRLAHDLDIGPYLRLGWGEIKTQGRTRPALLADALEALIGAIYLDAGFETTLACVSRWYQPYWDTLTPGETWDPAPPKDPKSILQEQLQAWRMDLPMYTVIAETGKPHEKTFRVQCQIAQIALVTEGEGTSRRRAEQAAAQQALRCLAERGTPVRGCAAP